MYVTVRIVYLKTPVGCVPCFCPPLDLWIVVPLRANHAVCTTAPAMAGAFVLDYVHCLKGVFYLNRYIWPPCAEVIGLLICVLVYPFLKMVGFDSVDDESRVSKYTMEGGELPAPSDWTSTNNPPYSYWIFYMYANIRALNLFLEARNMRPLSFRSVPPFFTYAHPLCFSMETLARANAACSTKLKPQRSRFGSYSKTIYAMCVAHIEVQTSCMLIDMAKATKESKST